MIRENLSKGLIIGVLVVLSLFGVFISKQSGITGFAILDSPYNTSDSSLVLYISFDNDTEPWKDYSQLSQNLLKTVRLLG